MNLTRSIANFWAVGVAPPYPCNLQVIKEVHVGFNGNYLPNRKVILSDGINMSSMFVYSPQIIIQLGDMQAPNIYSVIRITNTRYCSYQGRNYHFFGDYNVIAESPGRICLINNPYYLDSDPECSDQVD